LLKFKIINSDIFTIKDLSLSSKKILLLLNLIHFDKFIEIETIHCAYRRKFSVEGMKLPSQLREHLNILARENYIKIKHDGVKISGVELNLDRMDSGNVAYIRSDIPKNLNLSISQIYSFCSSQAYSNLKHAKMGYVSAQNGMHRTTYAKHAKALHKKGLFSKSNGKKGQFNYTTYRIAERVTLKYRQIKRAVNDLYEKPTQKINNKLLNINYYRKQKFLEKKIKKVNFDLSIRRSVASNRLHSISSEHFNFLVSIVRKRLGTKELRLEKKIDFYIYTYFKKVEPKFFRNLFCLANYLISAIKNKPAAPEVKKQLRQTVVETSITMHAQKSIGSLISKLNIRCVG